MTSASNHRRDVITAKSVLRGIEKRRHARAESARSKVMDMMAKLDSVLSRLPDDVAEEDMREIERIVTTLRTADQSLSSGGSTAGMQSLELARARIERLVKKLDDADPLRFF